MPAPDRRAPASKIDISTEAFAHHAGDGYTAMRREGPVVWQAGTRGFLVTGYDDTAAALRSENLLAHDVSAGWRALSDRLGRDYGPAMQLFSFMPFTIDGPRHLQLRRAMAVAVAPFAGGHPAISAQIERKLAPARKDGGFDLAADFAASLLFDIMCDFLEVAHDERHELRPIPTLTHMFEGTMPERERAGAARQIGSSLAFLHQHVARMIGKSDQGFVSAIYNALPADEDDRIHAVAAMICVMLIMGNNAVGSCISAGTHRLKTQTALAVPQAEWESVSDDAIRYVAPVDFLHRAAAKDLVIGGCPIRTHERIILSPLSANLDPAEFGNLAGSITPRPGRNVGMTFGAGSHVCIGNRLSRTIIKQAFAALAALPELRLAGDVVYGRDKVIRTLASMPVQLQ